MFVGHLAGELCVRFLNRITGSLTARYPAADHLFPILGLLSFDALGEIVKKPLTALPVLIVMAPEGLENQAAPADFVDGEVIGVVCPAVFRQVCRAGHKSKHAAFWVRPIQALACIQVHQVHLRMDRAGRAGIYLELSILLEVFEAAYKADVLFGEPLAVVGNVPDDKLEALQLEVVE